MMMCNDRVVLSNIQKQNATYGNLNFVECDTDYGALSETASFV
jgi:hypothetical protein